MVRKPIGDVQVNTPATSSTLKQSSDDVQLETSVRVDPEKLRQTYLENEGSRYSARKIFGFLQAKPIDEVVAALRQHSKENPNGASAKTLQAFGLFKTASSVEATTQETHPAPPSSSTSSDKATSSSSSVTPKQGK